MNRKSVLNYFDCFVDGYFNGNPYDDERTVMENKEVEWAIDTIDYLLKEIDKLSPAKDMNVIETIRSENDYLKGSVVNKDRTLKKIDKMIRETDHSKDDIIRVLENEISHYKH